MKKLYCVFALSVFATLFAQATIRRVGFFANQIANQDYFQFSDAYAAAQNGDTILVFPGKSIPGTNINKKLILIGTGTFLDPNTTPKGNANLQAFPGNPTAGALGFQVNSAGSVIMGFDFQGSGINIGANNITIRRNANLTVTLSYNPNGSTSAPGSYTNLQLLENYRLTLNDYFSGFSYTAINISNNLIYNLSLATNSTYNGNITNNVWAYDNTSSGSNGGSNTMSNNNAINLGNGTWLFQNNALISSTNASPASNYNFFTFSGEVNSVFNYNINVQSYNGSNWPPTGTGNITIPTSNVSSVFNGFPLIGSFSLDNRYTLTANSPAKVANRPGSSIDAGMFGGPNPYKLSNIPSIPTIYQLTSPQGNNPSGSTIQFSVSTRANN